MRKYRRRLSFLLICSIVAGMLTMSAFAEVDHPYDDDEPVDAGTPSVGIAFPDVPASAAYAEAVRELNELRIITGDNHGNFNPNKTITRAEAATIICRMLGVEDEAKGNAVTPFVDVPQNHWASGYVAKAVELGIINGYGNGKFGPSDSVTYEQMIKMLVSAWGYNEDAEAAGGYPLGYLEIAEQLGMADGVSISIRTAAPRSAVAVICYNTLMVAPADYSLEE